MSSNIQPRVDLSQCEREPVHIPGAIQPHGVLLALDPSTLTIVGISDNAARILGRDAALLLGRHLGSLARTPECRELVAGLSASDVEERNPFELTLDDGARFTVIAHLSGRRLIIELEPDDDQAASRHAHVTNQARGSLVRLRQAVSLQDLCERTAREVRRMSGFDRVIIYTFKPDWSGEVLAEDCAEGSARYLGLRFPASDIPSQARALYASCRLRMIRSSSYTPSPLVGLDAGEQLDLTHASLRSISPVHLEYMRNMGVTASMGLSLMRGDQLWGLVTCNHESGEHFVPYDARAACGLLAEVVSTLIAQKEDVRAAEGRASYLDTQAKILQQVVQDHDVARGLTEHTPSLLDVTDATGAAFLSQNQIHCVGKTPPMEAIADLAQWLDRQDAPSVTTDSLPQIYAPAHAWKDVGCGLLACRISFASDSVVSQRNWLLWFRPEVAQTVSWGGDPNKPASATAASERLHPRTSFEQWKENVHLKCAAFKPVEVAAASSLAKGLVDVILEIEASRQIQEKARELALRTEQLHLRERSLQLVLDSTGDGLVLVGLDGRISSERSRAVEQWFVAADQMFFWDVLFAADEERAREFEFLWKQIAEGALPFEVSVDQMCKELTCSGRTFELGYKPVREAGNLSGILVKVEDVTERAAARLAAREAGEAQAMLAQVLRDPRGFGRTLAELGALSKTTAEATSRPDARRALHTLKGNAAMLGLTTLAELCHALEEQLVVSGDADPIPSLSAITEELTRIATRVRELAGDDAFDRIEIPARELGRAVAELEANERAKALARLQRWNLEPASRPLRKLAARARALASEMGKSLDVVVRDGDVRLDPDVCSPLWASLTHAVANAVDHGIETEKVRREHGKNGRGQLVLSAEQRSDGSVLIEITDDGAGIDLDAVRRLATERGLPSTTRDEVIAAIFDDALSTRSEVTMTSGRGVGLAAVREACAQLGAIVEVDTEAGHGTTLRFRIPPFARPVKAFSRATERPLC